MTGNRDLPEGWRPLAPEPAPNKRTPRSDVAMLAVIAVGGLAVLVFVIAYFANGRSF